MTLEAVTLLTVAAALAVYLRRFAVRCREFKAEAVWLDEKTRADLTANMERQLAAIVKVEEARASMRESHIPPPGALEAGELFQKNLPHFIPNSDHVWFPLRPGPEESVFIPYDTGGPH